MLLSYGAFFLRLIIPPAAAGDKYIPPANAGGIRGIILKRTARRQNKTIPGLWPGIACFTLSGF